jgi:D-amino peptidase
VLLVTGDQAVCDEGLDLLGPGLTTVPVKRGLGRFAARQVAPRRARDLIEDGARRALADLTAVAPYDPGSPCEIRVEFTNTGALDEYRHRHGVEVVGSCELVSRAEDWWSAWRQFFF